MCSSEIQDVSFGGVLETIGTYMQSILNSLSLFVGSWSFLRRVKGDSNVDA